MYTNPVTAAEALARGRFKEWYRLVNDPRYVMQQMKRDPMQRRNAQATDFASRMAILGRPSAEVDGLSKLKRFPMPDLKNDWNVDVGPIGVGSGNFPAKFTFNGGVSTNDIAIFNTSEPGSGTSATLIGLNDLYAAAPAVAFAYNTTTGDTVATSVAFDLRGDQIAFISTNGGHAYLNVLRFETVAGNGTAYGSPVTLTPSASPGAFTNCKTGSSSCLYRVEFTNGDTDTNSSPYYDYSSDKLWVGDNSGNLHEFTGVFNGSVAESGNPWGTTGATTILASPVYDGSTYVYVGASNGDMYTFAVSSGAKYATSATITGAGLGISDGPLVDVAASKLYVALGYDTSHDSGIAQLVTPGLGTVSEVYFGTGYANVPEYVGTFDNTHYLDGGTTGYVTTCNHYGGDIYFNPIAISGFVSGTRTLYSAVPGDQWTEVATTGVACSPQTEILNGTKDYVFLSVATSANATAGTCTAGSTSACVYGFIIGNATTYNWGGGAPTEGDEIKPNASGVASSTSGIIIDNTAAGGGSNVYFTTNSTTNGAPCSAPATMGCAIQVTQSSL